MQLHPENTACLYRAGVKELLKTRIAISLITARFYDDINPAPQMWIK